MEFRAKNLTETYQLAEQVAKELVSSSDQATVLCLYGELGSGKTAFTQGLAKALEITETVNSPTFVIEKLYRLTHPFFSQMVHIDAYRLETSKELLVLDFVKLVAEPKNLIVIEWPEKVADILPLGVINFYFTFIDESTRLIKYGQ